MVSFPASEAASSSLSTANTGRLDVHLLPVHNGTEPSSTKLAGFVSSTTDSRRPKVLTRISSVSAFDFFLAILRRTAVHATTPGSGIPSNRHSRPAL